MKINKFREAYEVIKDMNLLELDEFLVDNMSELDKYEILLLVNQYAIRNS